MSTDASIDVLTSTTVDPVGKTPMVKRTFYVSGKVWEAAKKLAEAEDKNVSDVVRELLERYVKRGGRP